MTIINSLFCCCTPKAPETEGDVVPQGGGDEAVPIFGQELAEISKFARAAEQKHPHLPSNEAVSVERSAVFDLTVRQFFARNGLVPNEKIFWMVTNSLTAVMRNG